MKPVDTLSTTIGPSVARTRPKRRFSPIRRRILTVNIFALAIVVAGILYLGEYRENLIRAELTNLRTQAEMFSAALGEGAVGGHTPVDQELVRDTANRIVRRMVESTDTRARLFHLSGQIVADSRDLLHAGRNVEVEVLAAPNEPSGLARAVFEGLDRFVNQLPGQHRYEQYGEKEHQHARHYPEVMRALNGLQAESVRTLTGTRLTLSVAVPVQRYKQILGAVLVSKSSRDIDEAMYEVRLDIIQIFIVTLGISLFLSLYLAGTIAKPILRLSAAADRIRGSLNRQHSLPDLKARDDEIGDLTLALRDMTDALWNRMDAIERFAADVSHEIKNPLTSLKSAVETAARVTDPEQQRKLLSIVQNDVERLDRLISDISDASRLDAELSRAELSDVDLGRMLETLVDVHQSTAGDAAAPEIVIELTGNDVYTVPGMEDRLVQVFRNLIINAITFSPSNGQITINLRHSTSPEFGKQVVATVSDEGPGIPEGKEDAIFQRFYTERPESEDFGKHSGLGLSISKQIVEAHNGTITAGNRLSSSGEILGAQFNVQLPSAEK